MAHGDVAIKSFYYTETCKCVFVCRRCASVTLYVADVQVYLCVFVFSRNVQMCVVFSLGELAM